MSVIRSSGVRVGPDMDLGWHGVLPEPIHLKTREGVSYNDILLTLYVLSSNTKIEP